MMRIWLAGINNSDHFSETLIPRLFKIAFIGLSIARL